MEIIIIVDLIRKLTIGQDSAVYVFSIWCNKVLGDNEWDALKNRLTYLFLTQYYSLIIW